MIPCNFKNMLDWGWLRPARLIVCGGGLLLQEARGCWTHRGRRVELIVRPFGMLRICSTGGCLRKTTLAR